MTQARWSGAWWPSPPKVMAACALHMSAFDPSNMTFGPVLVQRPPIGFSRMTFVMDAGDPFLRPLFDRYFEDYGLSESNVRRFGTIAVEGGSDSPPSPTGLIHRRCIQIPRPPRAGPSAA